MIAEPLVIYRPNCTLWHFAYEQINRIVFVTEEKKNDPSPPASAKNGQIKWFVDVHKWPLNVVEFMQFIIFNVSITNLNDISVFSIKVIVYWQINCHYLIICESTWHAMNTTGPATSWMPTIWTIFIEHHYGMTISTSFHNSGSGCSSTLRDDIFAGTQNNIIHMWVMCDVYDVIFHVIQ